MLSRIAESLFWIGRYVERADGTARIVDAMRLQLIEEPGLTEAGVADLGLSLIMGLDVGDGPVSFDDVRARLVFDASHTSSIIGAWQAARENARRARETLSTELWEGINAAWLRWSTVDHNEVTAAHLSWVRDRAALVHGIADSTMSHDEAYDFLVMGRSLERADMTARLVATGTLPVGPEWSSVLQSCGAHQAYLRTNRGLITDELAAGFLVLDRQFPRSILFALRQAETCLERLDPHRDRMGISDEARRRLGRVRTSLEYRRPGEVLDDLAPQMVRVQQAVTAASDAVARRYFPSGMWPAWQEEPV